MPVTKTKKIENSEATEKLPPNYYEFFEEKAAKARIVLKNNPVPEHLFKKK